MQPITVHNLPTPPREVELAFRAFCNWNANFEATEQWKEEARRWQVHEMDYFAILHDTGVSHSPWAHRHMVMEFTSDGYSTTLFVTFRGTELQAVSLCGDDDEGEHRQVYPPYTDTKEEG